MIEIDEIEQLRAERDDAHRMAETALKQNAELTMQLTEARADERQAMHYLEGIRQAAGHKGGFPSLIQKIARLRIECQAEALEWAADKERLRAFGCVQHIAARTLREQAEKWRRQTEEEQA